MVTKLGLLNLEETHEIEDAEFVVDGAPWLQAGLFELGTHVRYETPGDCHPIERTV